MSTPLDSQRPPEPGPATTPGRPFPAGPLLRAIAELDDRVESEVALHVATARVVFADYGILQHDFPELQEATLVRFHPELEPLGSPERSRAIRRIIDRWLLRNAAFISEQQAGQTRVNTPIETSGVTTVAYRPPRYGRALVVEPTSSLGLSRAPVRATQPRGLLDLKGAGVAPGAKPSHQIHSSGLLTLSDALYDLMLQRIIDEIFRRAETRFSSVPVYGVLDLGFEVVNRLGEHCPTGLQVRRAHRRPRGGVELPLSGSREEIIKSEIELLLRNYGLTSCSEPSSIEVIDRNGRLHATQGNQPVTHLARIDLEEVRGLARLEGSKPRYFDGINVQLTREVGLNPSRAQLVDFGHYTARWGFQHPVISLVRDQPLQWGSTLWPGDPLFVTPDPRLVLAEEFQAYPRPAEDGGVPDRPFRRQRDSPELPQTWANDLARQFHAGEVSADQVHAQLEDMVERATRNWSRG